MTNTLELLNKVAGGKILSRLDMRQAYFQIDMEPQSRKYTSFQTPFGTYKYLRMPMGLRNATWRYSTFRGVHNWQTSSQDSDGITMCIVYRCYICSV